MASCYGMLHCCIEEILLKKKERERAMEMQQECEKQGAPRKRQASAVELLGVGGKNEGKSCSVGICFPVYSTFKAIESKNKEDQDQWLIYWAVYGSFSIVEVFSDKLISWFPLYYHVKLAFLIWLQLPPTCGSRQLYVRYLRPFLLKHQSRLDQIAGGTSSEINRLLSTHQREIQFMKVVLQKSFGAAYQVIQDILRPSLQLTGNAPNVIRRDATEDSTSDSD